MRRPDYIFETSWEICNKIGGIYTVLSTKATCVLEQYKDNYLLIGPDVWKGTTDNPDFLEDESLFPDWKVNALQEGLKIRTGRWNIEGTPMVVLVDFSYLLARKDEIFAKFWETYQLDSIHGAWDYVEPALFGYTAGQVIRSFSKFYLEETNNIIAHFHEWMTGTGVLYLKSRTPYISTVFTTHATVLGRSISGVGLPLYSKLEEYDPKYAASDFKVISKHSLESTAAREADILTTVSGITARECRHFLGRDPEVITTNGFEEEFVPKGKTFNKKREKAREIAIETATTITGKTYADDTLLVITSGRYEYRNKGLDLFIKALGSLNKAQDYKRDIIAYITIPADQRGPTDVFRGKEKRSNYLTHKLNHFENDTILNEIIYQGITNKVEDNVHVIFVPAYLNGNDGVINLSYYDFLIGHDLSVFPSYYEPWGYTPLESIAFKIPTITTVVAGFGDWVKNNFNLKTPSVTVIKRTESNDADAIKEIARIIKEFKGTGYVNAARDETVTIFKEALWKSFVYRYFESWDMAIEMAEKRKTILPKIPKISVRKVEAKITPDRPEWKKIIVEPPLATSQHPLKEMAFNLWWSWNTEAIELFESIAPERWRKFEYNPVHLLESLSLDEIDRLAADKDFNQRIEKVYSQFKAYMAEADNKPKEQIAYFSMEYGLHASLQIYSGGLGILAGDYLKQASDSNKNLMAIGLLYRQGYFKQSLSILGDQISEYKPQKFTQLPLIPVRDKNGEWVKVKIAMPGRAVTAKAWKVNVGRIPLYLLDTDITENNIEDRTITNQLYGGDNEHRLKQEMVLGLGGIQLIKSLVETPDVYHLNEGHSAFSSLERIRILMEKEGFNFETAVEVVKSATLFTTHTPVPAGHDSFEEHLMRAYMPHYSEYFKISWEEFIGLGRFNPINQQEKFSMSVLALKLAQQVNGVSQIHGRVSQEMFQSLYPGYYTDEIHIGYVTNGVHYYTWTDKIWQQLYKNTFGNDFVHDQPDASRWEKIYEIQDEIIWNNRLALKSQLIEEIKRKQKHDLTLRFENPKVMLRSLAKLSEKALIFGFARRFATYKRAHLLFTNLERLSAIVNNEHQPVIFLFAGKAHPNDKAGQDLIKRIIEISRMPEFIGKVIFLQDYDMTGGKLMTSCVDVWLNTPTRPLEASGTSGEKAVMNGVMNFSVLDGWWAEGYQPGAGWAIEEKRSFYNQQLQDELDAEIILNMLEQEIVPMYYNQDEKGIPGEWINHIKNTIARIAPHFTMQRMLNDYYSNFYSKLFETGTRMTANSYKHARDLVQWKEKIKQAWDHINVESLQVPDSNKGFIKFGEQFSSEIILSIPDLDIKDIGVEILMGNKTNGDVKKIDFKMELEPVEFKDGKAKYTCEFPLKNAGVHDYSFRIFPKHPDLIYRMDFPLVKWV
ncbi:MAG: alpha-glucan family phosphorylase [Marinilabiliales bacterium]|nr:MAG: alpha-glucan family phosphorylase [Marinilabiliales bacterium]